MKVEGSYAPKGNWVARNLRLVNDDSKELFPKTPADAKAARFRTMYKEDFHEFPTEVLLEGLATKVSQCTGCLLYTSPSPRDQLSSRMPSSA